MIMIIMLAMMMVLEDAAANAHDDLFACLPSASPHACSAISHCVYLFFFSFDERNILIFMCICKSVVNFCIWPDGACGCCVALARVFLIWSCSIQKKWWAIVLIGDSNNAYLHIHTLLTHHVNEIMKQWWMVEWMPKRWDARFAAQRELDRAYLKAQRTNQSSSQPTIGIC